jgi:hypothetical protein
MRILCITGLLASCFAVNAAELRIPNIALGPGQEAVAEIRYAAQGSRVAALQLDLNYDAASLRISAVAGPAATARGKVIASADVAPGRKRILLYGFNQSVLADGVVVSLSVSAPSGVPGSYDLRLTDAIAVNEKGSVVPLATIDSSLTLLESGVAQRAATFGQVVSGGPWKTTLTLVNVSRAPAAGKLNFWGSDGQPLLLPLAFPGVGGPPPALASSIGFSLDPGATLVVESEALDALDTQIGWVELQDAKEVLGFAVLRLKLAPDRNAEAMLAFDQRQGSAFLVPYDNSDGFQTGIAVTNQSPDSPADLTLVLRDEAGSTLSTEFLSLPARGHVSMATGDTYKSISGRRGTIEVRSSSSGSRINVLGLRFSPFGSFTSIPTISMD